MPFKESQKCRNLTDYYTMLREDGIIYNQHEILFNLLNDFKPHTIQEITGIGISQYNARIKELRDGNNKVHGKGVICSIECFRINGKEKPVYYKQMMEWRYKTIPGGKKMDVSEFMQTTITLDLVKQTAPGVRMAILNPGMKETHENRTRLKFLVEYGGRQLEYWPNKTSMQNIAKIHGTESNNWVGKLFTLEVGTVNNKEAIIAKPVEDQETKPFAT